jgi:hypothetical protein
MSITLLTLKEAAERYGIAVEQLRDFVRDGRISLVVMENQEMVSDDEVRKVVGKNGNHVHWVSLSEAAAHHALDAKLLERLAKDGVIRFMDSPDGLMLASKDVELVATELSRANFRHLERVPISMSEAARKYGFSVGAVFNWVRKGYVHVVGTGPKTVFVNEADVAYARCLADLRGMKGGRALFPASPQYQPRVALS